MSLGVSERIIIYVIIFITQKVCEPEVPQIANSGGKYYIFLEASPGCCRGSQRRGMECKTSI